MTDKPRIAAFFILLQSTVAAGTVTLKLETKEAWDEYLQRANAAMQAHLQPGTHFLRLDDQPNLAERIRTRGPHIAPVGRGIPKKVPSGLIHDWLGVGFVPNARIDDILRIFRDYDRYKEIYRPGVIDSISRSTDATKDLSFIRLVNSSVVA